MQWRFSVEVPLHASRICLFVSHTWRLPPKVRGSWCDWVHILLLIGLSGCSQTPRAVFSWSSYFSRWSLLPSWSCSELFWHSLWILTVLILSGSLTHSGKGRLRRRWSVFIGFLWDISDRLNLLIVIWWTQNCRALLLSAFKFQIAWDAFWGLGIWFCSWWTALWVSSGWLRGKWKVTLLLDLLLSSQSSHSHPLYHSCL